MHCVKGRIIKISPFWTLLSQNLNDCLVFPFFSFCHIWKHFLLKYSGYFVWDLHTLLDRGNLCHSDVWYILCFLLRVFVSTVTWDFCTALLVPCTSKLVFCHFYSHFCLVLAFVHCAFFAVVIFCFFSVFLTCPFFLQLLCGSSL